MPPIYKETIDGRWLVSCGGIQWGPPGSPRDLSGCASDTWDTEEDARIAFETLDSQ